MLFKNIAEHQVWAYVMFLIEFCELGNSEYMLEINVLMKLFLDFVKKGSEGWDHRGNLEIQKIYGTNLILIGFEKFYSVEF